MIYLSKFLPFSLLVAECLNLYFPDLYDTIHFGKSKAEDFVELPTFSLSGEGTAYKASASTATEKAVRALISSSTDFGYCNDLANVSDFDMKVLSISD